MNETSTATPGASTAAQLFAVMRLSRQQVFRNRRTLVFILLALVTPVLAVLFTVIKQMPAMAPPITGWDFFSFLMVTWYLQALLLLVALFYGTHLINSEVEEKTLTYLLIRPVPRPLLVLGKFLTYLIFAATLLLSSMALTWGISELADGVGGFGRHLPYVLWDAGVLALGAMAYGALFTLFGTALRRPILFGLSFVFVWESLVTYIPGRFGKFTIKHYLLSIFPHSTVASGVQNLFQSMTSRPIAVVVLLFLAAAFLALAMLQFSRREYVLEQ